MSGTVGMGGKWADEVVLVIAVLILCLMWSATGSPGVQPGATLGRLFPQFGDIPPARARYTGRCPHVQDDEVHTLPQGGRRGHRHG